MNSATNHSLLHSQLDEYLVHVAIERGLSENTVAAYRRDLQRYVEFLQHLNLGSLSDVKPADISRYLQSIRTGADGGRELNAASATRSLASIRGWHRFEVREGRLPADPASDVAPPSTARKLPQVLSVEQVTSLIEAAGVGEEPIASRDSALLELLYGTGARVSEAVGLAIDDVDTSLGALRLVGKGRKQRMVPLGSYAAQALDRYVVQGRPALATKGTGNAYLFLNTRGRPLSRQSAWEIIQRAADRAGMSGKISPHTLRHSYATHLLSGGADVRVVQELLGHASVTTTQIYTHVTPDAMREVYLSAHPRARES